MKTGKQTPITDQVIEISKPLKSNNSLETIFNILSWIKDNIRSERHNPKIFRQRTGDQIITDGFATGCTDLTLVALSLLRSLCVEAKYVELIDKRWLKEGGDMIKGHVIAEMELDGTTYYIDPTHGHVGLKLTSGMVVYDKGLDSWDIGIKNMQDMKEKFEDFRQKKGSN